jgi:hypothetical protein
MELGVDVEVALVVLSVGEARWRAGLGSGPDLGPEGSASSDSVHTSTRDASTLLVSSGSR